MLTEQEIIDLLPHIKEGSRSERILNKRLAELRNQPSCSCGETANLTECPGVDGPYYLCPRCRADEELR